MRWVVASVVAVAAVWGAYLASPYWALYRLASAMERRDLAEIAERINVRALRVSLARQVAGHLSQAAGTGALASQDVQLGAAAALALADPLFEALVTPSGIGRLLFRAETSRPDGAPFGGEPMSLDDLGNFLAASSWRGFRNVYVSLPPGAPAETRYRLQLRFGRLRWRLVSLELPAEMRRRVADDILRRR